MPKIREKSDYDAELSELLAIYRAHNALIPNIESNVVGMSQPTTVVTRWVTSDSASAAEEETENANP